MVYVIEWARILPEWLEIMDEHRKQRLNEVVYEPRQRLLVSEYDKYVKLPDTPHFDLLPHADELARFPSFRDILKAPEGTQLGEKPFESAFAKLPGLVEDWRKQLDSQLAELVKIPARLSLQGTPSRQVMASMGMAKLHLACALFDSDNNVCFRHPEIFMIAKYSNPDGEITNSTESFLGQYRIKFSEEAPYVVRACGLDPNVATRDDMNRRNARLRCLSCSNRIMGWYEAVCLL